MHCRGSLGSSGIAFFFSLQLFRVPGSLRSFFNHAPCTKNLHKMAWASAGEKTAYQPLADADGDEEQAMRRSTKAPRAPAMRGRQPPSLLFLLCMGVVAALMLLSSLRLLHGQHAMHCHGGGAGGGSADKLTVAERVDRILEGTPLIDGHDDFAIAIRFLFNNHINDKAFRKGFETDGLPQHVDLPRLRAGKNGGAFWSVFTPCPENGTDLSDANYVNSVRDTLQQIDVMERLKAAYPDVFSPDVNSSTALAAFARGQLISPLGIEGLHQIGNSVANLRRYYAMGVRYATLTHNVCSVFCRCPGEAAASANLPSAPTNTPMLRSGRALSAKRPSSGTGSARWAAR